MHFTRAGIAPVIEKRREAAGAGSPKPRPTGPARPVATANRIVKDPPTLYLSLSSRRSMPITESVRARGSSCSTCGLSHLDRGCRFAEFVPLGWDSSFAKLSRDPGFDSRPRAGPAAYNDSMPGSSAQSTRDRAIGRAHSDPGGSARPPRPSGLGVGIWELGFVWDLGIGTWDLPPLGVSCVDRALRFFRGIIDLRHGCFVLRRLRGGRRIVPDAARRG
jgi:hypothetical protein